MSLGPPAQRYSPPSNPGCPSSISAVLCPSPPGNGPVRSSAPRGIQLARRSSELANVPFHSQPCTVPQPFKSPLSGSGTRAARRFAVRDRRAAAPTRQRPGTGNARESNTHARIRAPLTQAPLPAPHCVYAVIGSALRTRRSRHRTAHARACTQHCARAALHTVLRTRHDRHSTAHARASAPHCAWPRHGTALRMSQPPHGTAHEPVCRRSYACARPGTARRMRFARRCTARAATCPDPFACAFSSTHLRVRRF